MDLKAEEARLTKLYAWFRKGDNRFFWFATAHPYECALFNAYDVGAKTFVEYLDQSGEREFASSVTTAVATKHNAKRETSLVKSLAAKRAIARKLAAF